MCVALLSSRMLTSTSPSIMRDEKTKRGWLALLLPALEAGDVGDLPGPRPVTGDLRGVLSPPPSNSTSLHSAGEGLRAEA